MSGHTVITHFRKAGQRQIKQLKEKNSSQDNKAKINVDFMDFVSDMDLEMKFKLRYFFLCVT